MGLQSSCPLFISLHELSKIVKVTTAHRRHRGKPMLETDNVPQVSTGNCRLRFIPELLYLSKIGLFSSSKKMDGSPCRPCLVSRQFTALVIIRTNIFYRNLYW